MQEIKKNKKNRFQFLTRSFPKLMKKKLAMQYILVLLAFGVLLARVMYIVIVNGEGYELRVLDQESYDSRTIPFKRGDIVDANGTTLATSERVYSVILDVKVLLASSSDEETLDLIIEETTNVLVDVFDIDRETIETAIEEKTTNQYVVLKKYVDYDTAKIFEECDSNSEEYPYLTAVWLEEGYTRTYPYDSLASGVLGFAGSGNIGVGGVEQYYNETLNGVDGLQYGYFYDDATEITVEAAENGNTVVLSIDQNLQSIVEEQIAAFNEKYTDNYVDGAGSANTAVIITDPNTGAILASATYPNYDLNNPNDLTGYYTDEEIAAMTDEETSAALNTLRSNYVVSSTFEPGSTVKPFTVAAGLETGAIDGTECYTCTGGLEIEDYYISCVNTYGHGILTVEEAIAESCNSALMQIATSIGIIDFTTYQSLFGFGTTTGVDLPSEASTTGLIYTSETMSYIDLMTNSFGQSFNVTMIQMVAAFGSLVNGGNYYEPYIVQQIQDSSGSVIENTEPTLVTKTVSQSTTDTVAEYLRAVVEYGSGDGVYIEGYDIGGKTGTAEKLPRGNGCYVVSFIGCVPVDDPEILIYVVVDEPNVENQATSAYAQEIALGILEEALPYLGVTKVEDTSTSVDTGDDDAAADTDTSDDAADTDTSDDAADTDTTE